MCEICHYIRFLPRVKNGGILTVMIRRYSSNHYHHFYKKTSKVLDMRRGALHTSQSRSLAVSQSRSLAVSQSRSEHKPIFFTYLQRHFSQSAYAQRRHAVFYAFLIKNFFAPYAVSSGLYHKGGGTLCVKSIAF